MYKKKAFYVAPSGSDHNGGTIGKPFLTLEKARDAMRSSDIKAVYLRAGTYPRTKTLVLEEPDSGQIWQAYPGDPANSVIIEGETEGVKLDDIIDILGGCNITIDGLRIRSFTARGIGVHGGAAYVGYRGACPHFIDCGIASRNTITNCIVENGVMPSGKASWDRAGIHAQGNVPGTTISHNLVQDLTGYGIGIWSLQEKDSITGCRISGNAVLKVGKTMDDGGAIYTLDRNMDCVGVEIKNNFIRDYGTFEGNTRAIYLDDQSSNMVVSGNIVAGSGTQPVLVHSGKNNKITGNIFDIGSSGNLCVLFYVNDVAVSNMSDNTFTGNIILSDYAVDRAHFGRSGTGAYIMGGNYAEIAQPPQIRDNFYHNNSTGGERTDGISYKGQILADLNPIKGDPKISGRLYTIAPDSSVYKAPVNLSKIIGKWGPKGYEIT